MALGRGPLLSGGAGVRVSAVRRYRAVVGWGLAALVAGAVVLVVIWDEWGSDESGGAVAPTPSPPVDFRSRVEPPGGRFVDLSASTYGTCGVRVGGALECWGSFPGREEGVPEGSFVAVSLGEGHACALGVDASMVCWGDNEFGEADAPAGGFVYVDVGEIWGRPVSCGVRVGGSVVCWGVGEFGHLEVPQQGGVHQGLRGVWVRSARRWRLRVLGRGPSSGGSVG